MPHKHDPNQIRQSPPHNYLLQVACDCIAQGIALLPVGPDKHPHWDSLPTNPETGKKTWKPFALQHATIEKVEEWLRNGATGLAAICGESSGGLLVWDIDIRRFFTKWTATRRVSEIFSEHQVPVQVTGGGGVQIFMRCDEPGQARKLAWIPDESEVSGRKIAIETRAEGNYAILPGSLHPQGTYYEVWDLYRKNFALFPQVEMENINYLFSSAIACCEAPKSKQQLEREKTRPLNGQVSTPIIKKATESSTHHERVIDLFNNTYDIEEMLRQEGYTHCHGTRYARPGGTNPSVEVFLNTNTSYHHNTNDPLCDEYSKTPFNVWCWYNHNDDVQEAVKEAAILLGPSLPAEKQSFPQEMASTSSMNGQNGHHQSKQNPNSTPNPQPTQARLPMNSHETDSNHNDTANNANERPLEYSERVIANRTTNQAYMALKASANNIAHAKQYLARIRKDRPWEEVGAALKSAIFDDALPIWQNWSTPKQATRCAEVFRELADLQNGLELLSKWADEDDPPYTAPEAEFSFEQLKAKVEQATKDKSSKDELADMMEEWVVSVAYLKKGEINKLCRLLKKAGATSRNIQYWRSEIKDTRKEIEEARKAATTNQDNDEILTTLYSLGYVFRLNECNGYIEVNGENLSDPLAAKIRVQMRKQGFRSMPTVEDTYIANAYDNSYHPLKDYLRSLKGKWDGQDHIAHLASHFEDAHDPILCDDGITRSLIHTYLRRWLIGAVAKVFGDGQFKNYCIVFEGKQGIGKSYVVVWLSSVMPGYFIEDEVKPSNKDHKLRLTSNWIWEIAELGSTTRKADVEALKHFITTGTIKVRPPYGRYPIQKPAITSFFGTVNDDDGFLRDRTGNRRFLCVTIKKIDRSYSQKMNPTQIWNQAVALYLQGETGELTPGEEQARDITNQRYQITNPAQDWIFNYYKIDPEGIEFTTDIVQTLQKNGYRGTTRSIQMDISSTLRSLGLEKAQISKNNKRAVAFFGISKIKPPRCPNCGEARGENFFQFNSKKYGDQPMWHCKLCHDPSNDQNSFWPPEEIEED